MQGVEKVKAMAEEYNQNRMDRKNEDALWDLLYLYADGEASPAECAEAEALLSSSAEWKERYAMMAHISSTAAATPMLEPPASLRAAIRSATTMRPTPVSRLQYLFRSWRLAPVLGAAACAAALVFFVIHLPALQQHPAGIAVVPPPPVASAQIAADIPQLPAMVEPHISASVLQDVPAASHSAYVKPVRHKIHAAAERRKLSVEHAAVHVAKQRPAPQPQMQPASYVPSAGSDTLNQPMLQPAGMLTPMSGSDGSTQPASPAAVKIAAPVPAASQAAYIIPTPVPAHNNSAVSSGNYQINMAKLIKPTTIHYTQATRDNLRNHEVGVPLIGTRF